MDKQQQVLDAVFTCVAQYGFKRTTMDDIAKAAGMSRTALYHYYKNKQDIFVALSHLFHHRMLEATQDVLSGPLKGEAFLYALLYARTGLLYATIHSSSHGREITDEYGQSVKGISNDALEQYAANVEQGLLQLAQSNQIDLTTVFSSNREAADFIIACAEGLMEDRAVNNLQDYEKKLHQLVSTCYQAWKTQ